MRRILGAALAAALTVGPVDAETLPQIHYAPAENLERIDVALIDAARTRIDMAAYVLTDRPVIEALARAARRGVAVRLYRTHVDAARRTPSPAYRLMQATPGVAIRIKRGGATMHLKSYAIDGRMLRTGAANFSASGLKRQDNDLIILESPEDAARFEAEFARIWDEGEPAP